MIEFWKNLMKTHPVTFWVAIGILTTALTTTVGGIIYSYM